MDYGSVDVVNVETFPALDGQRRVLVTYADKYGYRFPRIETMPEAA